MVVASPRGRLANESRRFDVELTVVSLAKVSWSLEEDTLISLDVKWKGPKSALGSRFRKSQKKDSISPQPVDDKYTVVWGGGAQKFKHHCTFLGSRVQGHEEVAYQPWDVNFVVQKASASAPDKTSILGRASLNLSAFGSESSEALATIPVETEGKGEGGAELQVQVSMVELRDDAAPAPTDSVSRLSSRHARSRSLSILDALKNSAQSANLAEEPLVPLPLLSSDADDEAEGEGRVGESVELPLRYNSMVASNLAAAHGVTELAEVDRTLVHPLPQSAVLERTVSVPLPEVSDGEEDGGAAKSRGLFKKRKLSFRSPKGSDSLLWTKEKEEPLLNKVKVEEEEAVAAWENPYTDSSSAEHGRWLEGKGRTGLPPSLSSDSLSASDGNHSSDSEEEHKVGAWQPRQIVSRDGSLRLLGEVFFASFDQRSESAAGESACTALVAVIADWLHQHPGQMPTKAVFNSLIQEGSREWRALCEAEEYKERFKDRHFDLETVLGARIRPLKVDHFHSFVGFFQPPELGTSEGLLAGSMSFDSIWAELARGGGGVYIVSWNDHFFILKLDDSGCYIIDTLGERLVEGCSRAFMLRFEGGCSCKQVAETQAEICKEVAEKAAAAEAEKERAAGPKKKQKPSPYAGGITRVSAAPAVKASEKDDSPRGSGLGRTLSMSALGALLGRTSSGSFGAGSRSAEKAASVAKEDGKRSESKPAEGQESKDTNGKASAANEAGEPGSGRGEALVQVAEKGAEVQLQECGLTRGMCKGRHFVKEFLAAVPLRALAEDLKAKRSVQVHQRLQIEFNYTGLLDLFDEKDVKRLG